MKLCDRVSKSGNMARVVSVLTKWGREGLLWCAKAETPRRPAQEGAHYSRDTATSMFPAIISSELQAQCHSQMWTWKTGDSEKRARTGVSLKKQIWHVTAPQQENTTSWTLIEPIKFESSLVEPGEGVDDVQGGYDPLGREASWRKGRARRPQSLDREQMIWERDKRPHVTNDEDQACTRQDGDVAKSQQGWCRKKEKPKINQGQLRITMLSGSSWSTIKDFIVVDEGNMMFSWALSTA